ncbi:hypothetical protein L798_11205 [Zootermopsis nevadensis]|uniref:Uncharacterized protein n=1 Tax=Zootermopsis nevadensis TaxID=136037 RepID=A0A067QWS8_ZOONE|nr:hypothetical protein L798_11205 [Zootermopsis nevadensis]
MPSFKAEDCLNNNNSGRTAKKTQRLTISKINWLTLFKEIIPVYTDNHTKPMIIKSSGAYSLMGLPTHVNANGNLRVEWLENRGRIIGKTYPAISSILANECTNLKPSMTYYSYTFLADDPEVVCHCLLLCVNGVIVGMPRRKTP